MKHLYKIMSLLAIAACAISLKNGEVMAALDKLTISMLWYIIAKHNDWVDELKRVIDVISAKLNDIIEEAEKELQKS